MKSKSEWTRRDFLKASFAGAIATGGIVSFSSMAEALGMKAVSRFTGLPLDAVPTTCGLCKSRCGVLAFMKDGRLRGILGNPLDPETGGKICLRGLTIMNVQDDPERILFPMIRTGGRGDGRWKRITWDEAFFLLVEMFQESKRPFRGRDGRILIHTKNNDLLTKRFLSSLMGKGGCLFLNEEPNRSAEEAHRLTWGAGIGVPDLTRARTILNFGANPLVHHPMYLPFARRLIDAKVQRGARIITFDVQLTQTGSISSEWFPVAPGTDGHLILAMIRVIMEMGLHDRAFIERWTNCTEERLMNHLAPYTLERAGEVSTIKPDDIKRIAIEFASQRPSVAFSGEGVWGHVEGTQTERAVILLNAITGNIDRPGGYCIPREIKLDEEAILPSPGGEVDGVEPSKAFMDMLSGSLKADILMIHMANPVHDLPQASDIVKMLRSEDRVSRLVVMDTHMSETASLADMVLPSATYLESWGVESRPSMEKVDSILLRQPVLVPLPDVKRLKEARKSRFDLPVVRPRGEALQWEDLLINIARRMGGETERAFPFNSIEQYIGTIISRFPDLLKEGGISYLRRNGIWVKRSTKSSYLSHEPRGFATPSGRLEIYSKELEQRGLTPLPSFRGPERVSGRKLRLIPFRGIPSEGMPNAKWSAELAHENHALLNVRTAERLGVSEGGWIVLSSGAEPVVLRVKTSEGIHPDVVCVARGLGHRGYGQFARGRRSRGKDPDSHLLWWEGKGNGTHIEPLVQLRVDPISGGQAWMETVVMVQKA